MLVIFIIGFEKKKPPVLAGGLNNGNEDNLLFHHFLDGYMVGMGNAHHVNSTGEVAHIK